MEKLLVNNLIELDGLKRALLPMAKACPKFWSAVTGRRYILPNYRCGDYFNQEYLDSLFAFFFHAYLGGDFGTTPDPVIRATYLNQVMAMEGQRPVYFLERELADVLMRAELPLDLSAGELHWIRRQFRVMLPRDLLAIERDGVRQSIMYLDIGHSAANEYLMLHDELEREVKIYARLSKLAEGKALPNIDVRPSMTRDSLCISGQITQSAPGLPGHHYGIIRPMENLAIGELIKVGEAFDMSAPCDTTDDILLDQMQHLAINILLFLGAVPLEYEVAAKELAEIRKLRVINDRVIPGLWPAKFIGRYAYRRTPKSGAVHQTGTGRTNSSHWVKGAWKRQPYGPKSTLRKLIFVETYGTGEFRVDKAKGA